MVERILTIVSREWQAFLDSFDDLPDGSLSKAGAIGTWSVRDIMGHITTWEGEVLKVLPLIVPDKPTPSYDEYGGIDAFNAQQVTMKCGLSLLQIRRDLKATHQWLIDRLSEIPETAVNPRFEQRFGEDTWEHYREHAVQIWIWRKSQSAPTL